MKLPVGFLETHRHPDIRAAQAAVAVAEVALKDVAASVRETCTHPIVVEAPCYSSNYGNSLPPFRVCIGCGFRERGWGCGYRALADADDRMVIDMERHEAYGLATEPERVSGWWIIPVGRVGHCDPYTGYSDE